MNLPTGCGAVVCDHEIHQVKSDIPEFTDVIMRMMVCTMTRRLATTAQKGPGTHHWFNR